jgi:hypothetical protein
MPSLTMRGRYLMREYWSDSDLFLRLSAEERELYVGLWMLADDDGWLPRDVPAIGAALFRYEDRKPREDRVRAGLGRLKDLGKVQSKPCRCLFLPAVARYPRAGKKTSEHRLAHQSHSNTAFKGIQRDLNPSPVPTLPFPSLPDVAPARAQNGAAGDEWEERVVEMRQRGMRGEG